jgi:hypothetical protein
LVSGGVVVARVVATLMPLSERDVPFRPVKSVPIQSIEFFRRADPAKCPEERDPVGYGWTEATRKNPDFNVVLGCFKKAKERAQCGADWSAGVIVYYRLAETLDEKQEGQILMQKELVSAESICKRTIDYYRGRMDQKS